MNFLALDLAISMCQPLIMPKRSIKIDDPIKDALRVVEAAIGETLHPKPRKRRKNPHAVALGRKGGLKGGVIRAKNLSPERRSRIARAAALARWEKRSPD